MIYFYQAELLKILLFLSTIVDSIFLDPAYISIFQAGTFTKHGNYIPYDKSIFLLVFYNQKGDCPWQKTTKNWNSLMTLYLER